MGNKNVKVEAPTLFSSDEVKALQSSFNWITENNDNLKQEKLMFRWGSLTDSQLTKYIVNFLFGTGPHRVTVIGFKRFSEHFYIVTRGTTDEKIQLIKGSIGDVDETHIALKKFENYIAAVFATYLIVIRQQSKTEYVSWERHGYSDGDTSIKMFSQSLTSGEEGEKLELQKLERWLQENSTFLLIWTEVFTFLYGKNESTSCSLTCNSTSHILPMNEGIPLDKNYSPIIDVAHVVFLNSNLPNEHRNKWRFLFSSKVHGESFSSLLAKILNKHQTLFIVEDENGNIFGGYAPAPWSLSPNFVGDESSILFTLSPAMRCFTATGYNDHYQYLNLNQQTMPNGLGMGGQFEFWGLWLDSEYGLGQSSESCTTYRDYSRLSAQKNFKIKNIEVWAIGNEPRFNDDSDDEAISGKRSILDMHLEDKVMLELAGHNLQSDGLRDPDMSL